MSEWSGDVLAANGQLPFLLAVAFIAGLARGFSGFGAALIFMPLASAVLGPKVAAPLLLVIDSIAALGLLPDAWRRANRRDVAVMALGAMVGVPLGAVLLSQVDPLTLRWTIVLVVVLLLVLLASGWRYRRRPAALLTLVVGGLSGLFTGVAQVGGPPVVAYWLGGAIPGGVVRANIVLFFAVSSAVTLMSYLVGGLMTPAVVLLALPTGPLYGLGLLAGARVFGRASEALFRRVCLGLIAAAAVVSLPLLDGVLR